MRLLEDVSLLQIAMAAHYQTGTSQVFVSPSDFKDMRRRAYDDSHQTVTKDDGDWFTVETEIGELTIARDDNEPDYDWSVTMATYFWATTAQTPGGSFSGVRPRAEQRR